MRSPEYVKETKPNIQLLCKTTKFKWTDECQEIFLQLKVFLASPLVIQRSESTWPIIVYLVVSKEVISAVLVQEIEKKNNKLIL